MVIKKELLLTVDENNQPIKPLPRDIVHKNGNWHRCSHIWIINNQKQILCQQRSIRKDINPGIWDPFFGGHLTPQQEYLEGALRELHEEVGISAREIDLTLYEIYKCLPTKEFQAVFYTIWNGDLNQLELEKEEVACVKWFPVKELQHIIIFKHDPQWSYFGYEEQLITSLAED